MIEKEIKEFNAKEFYEAGENIVKRSFYIKASAGTGKTYNIMKIVKKLLLSQITLDKILMVTYTEKAVGELKNRIRRELTNAIVEKKDDELDILYSESELKYFKNALKIVNQAPIFTIHSFCQKSLSQASFLACVPSALEVQGEAADELVEEKLRDEYALEDEFKNLDIAKMLASNSGIKDVVNFAIDRYYLTRKGEEDNIFIADEKEDENQEISNIDEIRYKKNKIISLYKEYLIQKQNESLQTFSDMLRSTREAVVENNGHNPFSLYLRKKYTCAIVDEFQDTNSEQWDIFKTLFFKDRKGNFIKDHFLIVVGDEKQSIYSFQKADVSVYNNAISEIKDGYRLSTNYRSSRNIIEGCNLLIGGKDKNTFFAGSQEIDFVPSASPSKCKESNEDKLEGIWIVNNPRNDDQKSKYTISPWEFAEYASTLIENLCKSSQSGKKFNYNDFALLYKQKSELQPILYFLKKKNIPFIRYKDTGLFVGKECADWIAILDALEVSDFAANNRKILNRALWTNFFDISDSNKVNGITALFDTKYDDIGGDARVKISHWRILKHNKDYQNLAEAILADSNLEERLLSSQLSDMVYKYRQIGLYITSYLLSRKGDFSQCIEHLRQLNSKHTGEEILDDGNIVEIGSDGQCVKVMTIHASKGLEFPVVISIAGFKGKDKNIPHCYIAHDSEDGGKLKIGFANPKIKNQSEAEKNEEFKRLFYVDYTRPKKLLVLPFYKYSYLKPEYRFLENRFKEILDIDGTHSNNEYIENGYIKIKNLSDAEIDANRLKEALDVFPHTLQESKEDTKENKKAIGMAERFFTVQKNAYDLTLHKYSYSSLRDGKLFEEQTSSFSKPIYIANLYQKTQKAEDVDHLRGAYFGNAIHKIFEECDFSNFANIADKEKYGTNLKFVADKLKQNGIAFNDKDAQIICNMVYHSLNACLVRIKGGDVLCKNGKPDVVLLSALAKKDKINEAEFLFNISDTWIRKYCNGFMDLVFRTLQAGKDKEGIYSILDWKSDYFEDKSDYWNFEKLKTKVDEEYSVQRVLYSYCLVKFLSEFYRKPLKSAFDENFGGIYYLFVRGAKEKSSNGIYAQSWNTWDDLQMEYEIIKNAAMDGEV